MSQRYLLDKPFEGTPGLSRRVRKVRQGLDEHPGKGYQTMDIVCTKLDLRACSQSPELRLIGRDKVHEDSFSMLFRAHIATFPP